MPKFELTISAADVLAYGKKHKRDITETQAEKAIRKIAPVIDSVLDNAHAALVSKALDCARLAKTDFNIEITAYEFALITSAIKFWLEMPDSDENNKDVKQEKKDMRVLLKRLATTRS